MFWTIERDTVGGTGLWIEKDLSSATHSVGLHTRRYLADGSIWFTCDVDTIFGCSILEAWVSLSTVLLRECICFRGSI